MEVRHCGSRTRARCRLRVTVAQLFVMHAPSSWEKMPPALKHKAKEARGTWTRFLAITALSLMFTAPFFGAFAQDSNEPPATFNERFPADQTSTQPSLDTRDAKKEQKVTTTTRTVRVKRVPTTTRTVRVKRVATATRIVGIKRARSRVVGGRAPG
jgi:hypothetical protein